MFRNRCLKPFPLRAAIDIGGGGMVALCIARVDVKAGAVQKILYQTQLPLHLEPIPISPSPTRWDKRQDASSSLFALGEASITDMLNKMEILSGAMDHHHRQFGGVDERAAVLTWPVCLSENAEAIATHLERRFRLRARVLGKDFTIESPFRRHSTSPISSCAAPPSFSVPFPSSSALSDAFSRDTRHQPFPHSSGTKRETPRWNLHTFLSQTNAWEERERAASRVSTTWSGPEAEGHGPSWTPHRNALPSVASPHDTPFSRRSPPPSASTASCPSPCLVPSPPRPPSVADMEMLAFLSHAAAAQCVAPHRLLVVDEDPHRGIRLVGMNTSAEEDCEDGDGREEDVMMDGPQQRRTREASTTSATTTAMAYGIHHGHGRKWTGSQKNALERRECLQKAGLFSTALPTDDRMTQDAEAGEHANAANPLSSSGAGSPLVEHRVSLSVPDVHRFCITTIQHRSPDRYHLHRSSPNPMLRTEFIALRQHLEASLAPLLPPWVRRKSLLGGMIGGTSFNGGMLNIAARVAQKSPIPLEHLEMHAEYHFCGLTDVLLAENFPHPGTVLPSAALASALCRVLQTPRLFYVPEVTTAVGLLLQPVLWANASPSLFPGLEKRKSAPFYANDHYQSRSHEAEDGIERGKTNEAGEMFYASPHYRWFHRPPIKGNPTAAPTAIWEKKK